MAESGIHFVGAFLHLLKQAFYDIGGADGLPVLSRKVVERETRRAIALQTFNGRRIDRRILFAEGTPELFSFRPTGLIEDRLEFGFDGRLLRLGHVAQDIGQFVFHSALAGRLRKLGG